MRQYLRQRIYTGLLFSNGHTTLKLYQIDAFTNAAFGGNPAAVCLLEKDQPEPWMRAVAAEMNLSETAFLRPDLDPISIRYFTPEAEIPLCGHATLASAHALWSEGLVPREKEIRFSAPGGQLSCRAEGDWIYMNFPALPATACDCPADLLAAIGIDPLSAHIKTAAHPCYLLEFAAEEQVRALAPDFAALRRQDQSLIATAPGDAPDIDFVSRFFAPAVGIDEDPVTGSAHCSLTPFWSAKLGKERMLAQQVSQRLGTLRVAALGDRVELGGQAVAIFRAELLH